MYEDTRVPAPALLKILRQAGGQGADGAHHRADKRVQRENLIAVFRLTFFRQQGFLHGIERAAARAAAARSAGADIGDDDRERE